MGGYAGPPHLWGPIAWQRFRSVGASAADRERYGKRAEVIVPADFLMIQISFGRRRYLTLSLTTERAIPFEGTSPHR